MVILNVVKYLVSCGADITAQNNEAVCMASENGHLGVVKYLVSLGADITAQENYAVRWASKHGNLDVVKYLVSLGADIRAKDNGALLWASEYGHLDVVKYFSQLWCGHYCQKLLRCSFGIKKRSSESGKLFFKLRSFFSKGVIAFQNHQFIKNV